MLNHLAQVGDGFLVVARMDIVVGIGIVPLLHGAPVDGVALHVAYYVFGVVYPVLLDVTFGEPGAGLGVYGGLRLVETTHVGEGGGGLVEGAFVELRTAHEHPCLPKEGVIFLSTEPFDVALGLLAALRPFGTFLDAMALDGFLGFLNGGVELTLAQLHAALVAYGVERDDFGEVVFIPLLLGKRTVNICLGTVEISVVTGIESMPPTALGGVFLRRTSADHHQGGHYEKGYDMMPLAHVHCYNNRKASRFIAFAPNLVAGTILLTNFSLFNNNFSLFPFPISPPSSAVLPSFGGVGGGIYSIIINNSSFNWSGTLI